MSCSSSHLTRHTDCSSLRPLGAPLFCAHQLWCCFYCLPTELSPHVRSPSSWQVDHLGTQVPSPISFCLSCQWVVVPAPWDVHFVTVFPSPPALPSSLIPGPSSGHSRSLSPNTADATKPVPWEPQIYRPTWVSGVGHLESLASS